MKKIFNKIILVLVATSCFYVVSCKKKDTSAPAKEAKATVAGTNYSASTQILIPNDSALTAASSTFNPQLPSGGGFISYTSEDTNQSVIGPIVTYGYFFLQANLITPGDTALFGFAIASLSPIDTGKYSFSASLPSKTGTGIYEDTRNYNDSTATGSVTITDVNTTSKTISGTYSFTIIDSSGTAPATVTITNGQLINIPYQKF